MGKENGDLLSEILVSRGELFRSLKGLRAETAWTRPEPEEWSVVEVLQHVANVDRVMVRRFRELRQGIVELAPHNRADWEAEMSAAEKDGVGGVLRRVYEARSAVLDEISELTATDLQRTVRHARRGLISGRDVVQMVITHDADHAGQIAKARAVVEA